MHFKQLFIFGLLLVAVLVGGYYAGRAIPHWRPGITPENFELLHEGMTEKEIAEILGEPGQRELMFQTGIHLDHRKWQTSNYTITIYFMGGEAWEGWLDSPDTHLEMRKKPTPILEQIRGLVPYSFQQ
jgi:hypothetical protein